MSAVTAEARRWVGTPYHHQMSVRGAGCDCLGLIRGIWRELVGPEPEGLPPYTPSWDEVDPKETLLAGFRRNMVEVDRACRDTSTVLVFRMWPTGPAKHCGVLVPGGIIHACRRRGTVEVPLPAQWERKVVAAFAWPGGLT